MNERSMAMGKKKSDNGSGDGTSGDLGGKEYEKELRKLQVELTRLQACCS